MIRPTPQTEPMQQDNTPEGGYNPAQTYTDLRTMVFGIDLTDLAQRRTDTIDRVWGIVMEAGFPEAAVTLLALADGTVSIYLSSGGGLTGLGDYEQIHDASQRLIGLATEFSNACDPVCEFPLPQRGHTRFYLLTYTGTLSIELAEQDLRLNSLMTPLWERGHELLAMIRDFGEQLALQRVEPSRATNRPN